MVRDGMEWGMERWIQRVDVGDDEGARYRTFRVHRNRMRRRADIIWYTDHKFGDDGVCPHVYMAYAY